MSFTDAFSVGTDASLDIFDPETGGTISFDGLTDFEATAMTSDLEHHALNREDRFATVYRGWRLTFGYDRLNGVVDAFFADREARYRSGRPVRTLSVTQTIQEADGTVSQYRFSRMDMKQASSGRWNRDDKVTGSVEGMAGLRERIV